MSVQNEAKCHKDSELNMFQAQEDVPGFPEIMTNDACSCSHVHPSSTHTILHSRPPRPTQVPTCTRLQGYLGHLGHRKTWYHSQVERQGRRSRTMVVGIRTHEMTSGDGACSKACNN